MMSLGDSLVEAQCPSCDRLMLVNGDRLAEHEADGVFILCYRCDADYWLEG
jgi:hypothetical protein